jgi:hypothetical protein
MADALPQSPLGFFALCMLWQGEERRRILSVRLRILAVAGFQIGKHWWCDWPRPCCPATTPPGGSGWYVD